MIAQRASRSHIHISIALALSATTVSPKPVTAQVVQKFKLASPARVTQQFFGAAVSSHGRHVTVGEPFGSSNNTGTAYLFDTETGARLRTYRALDASYIDLFGTSVAMNDSLVLIGSPNDDVVSPPELNSDSGSAYLFNKTTGQQLFKFTPSDGANSNYFGQSVAINDTKAIVGAYGNAGYSGAAYVFDVTTGQQLLKLTPSDPLPNKRFGVTVAADGNIAIIGGYHTASSSPPGAAYLFDVTTGQELFKLSASDAAGANAFGASVAIDGNKAVVGAWANDAAYVFDVSTGQEVAKLVALDTAPGDRFGVSVAIEGNLAVVSAMASSGSGSAYLFDVTTGRQLLKFGPTVPQIGDSFGGPTSIFGGHPNLTIAGDKIVAGAPTAGTFPNDFGAAYVFHFTIPEPSTLILSVSFLSLIWQRRRARN